MQAQRIESLEDPRVAHYRNVKDARLRNEAEIFLAEGRLGVRRLLGTERFETRSVFVTQASLRALADVLEPLGAQTPVYVAEQKVMDQIVGFSMHRGCVAVGVRGRPLCLDDLLVGEPAARELVVALDEVANPENVGGVFRNALAFGATGVLLTRGCADPLYRKALRVSMGACLKLPFARLPVWPDALAALHARGFRVAALSTDPASREVTDFAEGAEVPARLCLVVGSEEQGISAEIVTSADVRLRIPMAEGIDSLNVATASGIALHRIATVGPHRVERRA